MASQSQLQEVLDFLRPTQRQIFDKITGESKIDILLTSQAQMWADELGFTLEKKEIDYIAENLEIGSWSIKRNKKDGRNKDGRGVYSFRRSQIRGMARR